MERLRIACHCYTWGALTSVHTAPVFRQIAEAGYQGVEGLTFTSEADLVEAAASARGWGLQIVNATGRTPGQTIRFNAALGNRAAEVWEGPVGDFGSPGMRHEDRFPLVARFFEPLFAEAARYNVQLTHHIHIGQLVETNDHVDLLVRSMPQMGILFDTGHLLAKAGDPLRVIRDHGKRINHVHLKDFHRSEHWSPENLDWKNSHFAPLGQGNCGFDAAAILGGLAKAGYEGWVSVEIDPQPPLMAKGMSPFTMMKLSREHLQSVGF